MVDHKQNRQLLAHYFTTDYEVLLDGWCLRQAWDLCVVNGLALDRVHKDLQVRKAAEQPVILPVLLVTSRHCVGMAARHLWKTVDEFITVPIEKAELHARVEVLLRARQLSQENASSLRQVEAEVARAAEVQAELLPRPPRLGPALSWLRVAFRRQVGSDFYDWQQPQPEILTFTLGDSMGKGMPASLPTATVRTALRTVACSHPPASALRFGPAGTPG